MSRPSLSAVLSQAPREQREAFLELAHRENIRRGLLARSFDAQRAFVVDTSPLVAVQCSRRAGKTFGVSKKFIQAAYQMPGASNLYINLTGEGAERQLKKDCMDVELERLKIRAHYNKTKRSYLFQNGSMLYLLGMDADEKEREKALGQKYFKIIIDEAQSYAIDMEDLVYRVLKPAVADYRGQINLTGTPCNDIHTFYFKVVTGTEPGWNVHKWKTEDNFSIADKWKAEIADMMTRNPGVELLPWFRQQYLNEWVIDSEKLVYRYDPARDLCKEAPSGLYQVLGIDLGWEDATSFTVLGYRDRDPANYVLESWKRSHMYLSDVEQTILDVQRRYPKLTHIVVDNAAKQAVEEMKRRLAIPLIPADKAGKEDYIGIVNSDFQLGRIQLVEDTTVQLQEELQTLTWDEKRLDKGHKVEKAGSPNHCTDSFLYAHRFCYSWTHRADVEPVTLPLESKIEADDDEFFEREEKRNWWDR